MLPTRVPLSEDKLSYVRHPTSGLFHHIQRFSIWLPSNFQPKEFLHLLQFFNHGNILSRPFRLFLITVQVVVVFQVFLVKDTITETKWEIFPIFLKIDSRRF